MRSSSSSLVCCSSFRGDHNRIKTAVNQISGIALGALNEFDELIVAFDAGEFERRARAENYLGDWQKIMAGLNLR